MKNERQLILKKILKTSAEKLNKQSEHAMPSLHESIAMLAGRDANNALRTIIEDEKYSDEQRDEALKEFLKQHWDAIKGTYLSYTSIPTHEMSHLCCEIAEYLAQYSDGKSALSFLMPSIQYTDDVISFVDLKKKPLQSVIQMYIISDDNQSLIPVAQIGYLDLETKENVVLVNPFIQDEKNKLKPLSENEVRRILEHSFLTKEMMISKKAHNKIENCKTSLYGELLTLVEGLKAGGKHGLQGGTYNTASPMAWFAIQKFKEYWSTFTEQQKTNAREIVGFAGIVEKKICNPSWNDECVESIAKEIELIISSNRNGLSAIGSDKDQLDGLLEKYGQQFSETKAKIDSEEYIGRDQLFINESQIKKFVTAEAIQSEEDVVALLQGLQPKEIEIVCSMFSVQLMNVLQHPNSFVMVISALNPKQLESFLIFPKKKNGYVDLLPSGFAEVINILTPESAAVLCENAKGTITDSISDIESAKIFLEALHKDRKKIGWNWFESSLLKRIKKNKIAQLWKFVPEENQVTFLVEALPDMKPNEIQYIFSQIDKEREEKFWREMDDELVRCIKDNLKNFQSMCLSLLTETDVGYFWRGSEELLKESLKLLQMKCPTRGFNKQYDDSNISDVFKKFDTFKKIFSMSPEEKKDGLWNKLESIFIENIKNVHTFKTIWPLVPENKLIDFWGKVASKVGTYPDLRNNFNEISSWVPEKKKEEFWELVEPTLLSHTSLLSSKFDVLCSFAPKRKQEIFLNKVKDKLVQTIKMNLSFLQESRKQNPEAPQRDKFRDLLSVQDLWNSMKEETQEECWIQIEEEFVRTGRAGQLKKDFWFLVPKKNQEETFVKIVSDMPFTYLHLGWVSNPENLLEKFWMKVEDTVITRIGNESFFNRFQLKTIFSSVPQERREYFWGQIQQTVIDRVCVNRYGHRCILVNELDNISQLIPQEMQEDFWGKVKEKLVKQCDSIAMIRQLQLPKEIVQGIVSKYDSQHYKAFQECYEKRLGFFSNPFSRHWGKNEKGTDKKAMMEEVEAYAKQYPLSRTASVLKDVKNNKLNF